MSLDPNGTYYFGLLSEKPVEGQKLREVYAKGYNRRPVKAVDGFVEVNATYEFKSPTFVDGIVIYDTNEVPVAVRNTPSLYFDGADKLNIAYKIKL